MEWRDDGIILAVRPHGENAAITSILTPGQGRHLGLVRGGQGRRQAGVLQIGNQVRCHWRGRLAEHLGGYTLEPVRPRAALVLDNALRLAALSSVCALCDVTLAEREVHKPVYNGLTLLLDQLADSTNTDEIWPAVLVRFELGLLQELGFALDLSTCAATGDTEDLIYVSPKSGRAVSRDAGEPYKNKLLPLPAFLKGEVEDKINWAEIRAGLALTGYFFEAAILSHRQAKLPIARTRLLEIISNIPTIS